MSNFIRSINECGPEVENLFIEKATQLNQQSTHKHFIELKPNDCFKAFVACGENKEPIGGICAQICSGPVPLIPDILKFGSIWGFWGDKHVIYILIEKAVCYLRSLKAMKILTYAYSDFHFQILTELKFSYNNALACNLNDIKIELPPLPEGITIKAVGPEYDEVVYDHWRKMWAENGITTFLPNSKEITLDFLKESREKYNYRTTAAFDGDKIIGSASNNLFFGVEPCEKVGGAWAVYVNPEYRRRGIGTRITVEMEKYLKEELNCNEVRLIYASEEGRRIYERKGFKKFNWLSLELREINKYHEPFIADVEKASNLLSMAIPGQMKALGLDPSKSQFTGEVFKSKTGKMGKGFKADSLTSENKMAQRFDRLSLNWEESVTGMNYEYVFEWLVKMFKNHPIAENQVVLDECTGIGLPGMTIRMANFKGKLIGCDISKGMLTKAYKKGCFDDLFVQDMNDDLLVFDESVDVVINVGSLELLNIECVLKNSIGALKKNGQFWASFQWDNGTNPTDHQKIFGLKEDAIVKLLVDAGFQVNDIDKCENAFLTPKPGENGSQMVPVPYIFVRATKI